MRPAFTLSVANSEVMALVSAAESMPMTFDFLGGFIDRLAERGKLRRGDDDSRWVGCDGLFEDADLADYVGFGLCAEFDHVYAEILTGLARAGQARSANRARSYPSR